MLEELTVPEWVVTLGRMTRRYVRHATHVGQAPRVNGRGLNGSAGLPIRIDLPSPAATDHASENLAADEVEAPVLTVQATVSAGDVAAPLAETTVTTSAPANDGVLTRTGLLDVSTDLDAFELPAAGLIMPVDPEPVATESMIAQSTTAQSAGAESTAAGPATAGSTGPAEMDILTDAPYGTSGPGATAMDPSQPEATHPADCTTPAPVESDSIITAKAVSEPVVEAMPQPAADAVLPAEEADEVHALIPMSESLDVAAALIAAQAEAPAADGTSARELLAEGLIAAGDESVDGTDAVAESVVPSEFAEAVEPSTSDAATADIEPEAATESNGVAEATRRAAAQGDTEAVASETPDAAPIAAAVGVPVEEVADAVIEAATATSVESVSPVASPAIAPVVAAAVAQIAEPAPEASPPAAPVKRAGTSSVLAPARQEEYNRTGLDFRRRLPRPKVVGDVIDWHCHLLAAHHAPAWFEAADHYGLDRFLTMSPLEEAAALQRTKWGHRIKFIAVPRWGDYGPRWADEWRQRIEAFYNLGSRINKFHAAPQTMAARGKRLDDPAFKPIFREVVDRGMAIMTHIGDPDTWYAYQYADTAKHGTRDEHYRMWAGLLEEYRGVPWIGAHLGGNPENLARLQDLFDRFPDLWLDCSATRWMQREISARRDAAREFFIRNQDRILFGSDQVSFNDRGFDFYASRFWVHRKLWETGYVGPSPIIDPDVQQDQQPVVRGLALPDAVLQKLYHDNASRLLARLGMSF